MEFFNKKQDVIDIQITQFGRHLLSKGHFKPVYYSFFDDNILYDSNKAGIIEEQNTSYERIKETQTLRPQIGFSSLDKEYKNNYDFVFSGGQNNTFFSQALQRTPEKNYLLPTPIGTSATSIDNPPSWEMNFLKGRITGSSNNLEVVGPHGGKHILPIPQLECTMEVRVFNQPEVAVFGTVEDELDASFISEEVEDDLGTPLGGSIVTDKDNLYILIKALERNGDFQKKNFDIEMFEVIEDIENGIKIETLRPLSFSPRQNSDDIVAWLNEEVPNLDPSYAGYYVDIKVDDEIDNKIICALDPEDEKRGVFSDPREKACRDTLNQEKKVVYDIYSDEEDYPGEIC